MSEPHPLDDGHCNTKAGDAAAAAYTAISSATATNVLIILFRILLPSFLRNCVIKFPKGPNRGGRLKGVSAMELRPQDSQSQL